MPTQTTEPIDPGRGLSAWLASLATAPASTVGPLTCVPLLHDGPAPEPLLLGHDALAGGLLDYCMLIDQRLRRFEQARQNLRSLPNQVGVLILSGAAFVGLEAFGAPGAWMRTADRVFDSIIDAAAGRDAEAKASREERSAVAWLGILQGLTAVPHPALDLGDDLELTGPGFFGEAVWMDDHPAHVCLFAVEPAR